MFLTKKFKRIHPQYPMIALTKHSIIISFFETMIEVIKQLIGSQVNKAARNTMNISFLKLVTTYFKYGHTPAEVTVTSNDWFKFKYLVGAKVIICKSVGESYINSQILFQFPIEFSPKDIKFAKVGDPIKSNTGSL